MITLDHITFEFADADKPALHDICLHVDAGEAVCVMGRNGSGKSTLIRIIAGLTKPTRGQVTVNGEVPGSGKSARPGILFQNTDNQMVASLVEKELAFGLENQAATQEYMEDAVTSVCKRFALTPLRQRLTSGLSGGEKQRVALSSIMILNPPVLLLDEPDTFLDAEGQAMVAEELRRLHREFPDLTELRITQNPAIAQNYRRIIVVDGGEITADGEVEQVLGDGELLQRSGLVCSPRDLSPSVDLNGGFAGTTVSAVEARSVSFCYDANQPVLDNISLTVRSGETAALIGTTGAGKSSLGLLLCGILKPASGEVVYLSKEGSEVSAAKVQGRVVAVLQQAERQFFLDSCAKEVAFGPGNFGRKLSPLDVDAYLALVGLPPERFRLRDPFSLSEGEKRRLAFATALSMNPSVLIFDEPTAGLDPEGAGWFVSLSKLLRAKGKAQLIISHDRYLVRELADCLYILRSSSQLDQIAAADVDNSADIRRILAASHGDLTD